jgi:hypothetical protein
MSIKRTLKIASDYDDRPTITFTTKELPEIKKWEVGKKYDLEVEVEMIGINKDEYGEKGTTGRFRVTNVEVDDDSDEDDEDEKD